MYKLTVDSEGDLCFERFLAPDVAGLAPEPSVVVGGGGRELVEVLGEPALGVVHHVHLYVVAIPNELRRRISAPGAARQLHHLSAPDRLALREALDVRLSGRICTTKVSTALWPNNSGQLTQNRQLHRGAQRVLFQQRLVSRFARQVSVVVLFCRLIDTHFYFNPSSHSNKRKTES